MVDFVAEAESMRDELVARRRDFHRHPELAFQEERTAGIVADELNNLGLEVQTGVGKTGVVGLLEGDQDGPTVLWRADMDALPIQEENVVDYASQTPGKMHACGHDGHTAIALGVAKLFAKRRESLAGRIKFVFQPAEEIVGGAEAMVADGVLENPRPDVSLGLHLWNYLPLGTIGAAEGPVMAGSSFVRISISGRGGHAAVPQDTSDPVVCAAQLIMALQTIVSRSLDPAETVVLSITQVSGSDADNVIPEKAELAGTLRTYSTEARDVATQRIHEITKGVCQAMRCSAEVDVRHGTIPVVNQPDVAARSRAAFERVVTRDKIDARARTMASEDVALFMNDVPGTYFLVGSADHEAGLDYPHHHARFDFNEDALTLAVALAGAALADYVLPE